MAGSLLSEVQKENQRIAVLEKWHMPKSRRTVYVACEDMDFVWDEDEVKEFDHMWNEGLSLWDIAKAFDRDPDEVAILAMDRIRKGHVKKRPGWAFGRRKRA